ncbi:DUF1697 domain-containing protein [Dehalogenimonas etheniformans]|nr:DUF1697 domain-containing protein [Dehalogenimonas etheniformans]QNT76055.1 DUF1697 domain-containing protein [Dehalogenimonas etheniformans]
MNRYVAFLRGINSGSNPTLKMETLRKIFEDAGFQSVKTVLASGNVIFDAPGEDNFENALEKELEAKLGYRMAVIVLSLAEIKRLIESAPFAGIDVTPTTRLYITFTKSKKAPGLILPFSNADKGFTILDFDRGVIRSIVDLKKGITPDLMSALDKHFGKSNTARNWNTIEKIFSIIKQNGS